MFFKNKYKNKKVIVTGHTGFKGSWLSIWLNQLGADVIGVSDQIPTNPSNFQVSEIKNFIQDIRINIKDTKIVYEVIRDLRPDFIFNLAAQSLVRNSYLSPVETILTNAIGSVNILNAVKECNYKTNCIMITSDKVYRNDEITRGYKENDIIGGKDPYSASKGMAELAINSFFESYLNNSENGSKLAIARAGNVIGGGYWAKDRIVPDCINAWSNKKSVKLRNPNSTRPWQHVLEPLSGYLLLGSFLDENNDFNGSKYNFGPPNENDFDVKELIQKMSLLWPDSKWELVSSKEGMMKEAGLLKLDCEKALKELNWKPVLDFDKTVQMTIEWYKEFYLNKQKCMYEFSMAQIGEFTEIAKIKNLTWTLK